MADETKEPEGETEKRKHVRQLVLIPVYVERDQVPAPSLGLIRNVSVAGAYFLTQQRIDAGATLELTLHLTGDPSGPVREVTATVVRVEELDLDTTDLWFFGVGITFDEELTDLEDEIAELAKKLADAQ